MVKWWRDIVNATLSIVDRYFERGQLMNKIIGYDSPLMSLLGKLADLFFLNVITLLCCLPIITIGASLTACYYTALKIKRDEGHVFRNFWNSFRENLFSSTVLYLIFVILGVFMLFCTTCYLLVKLGL